MTNQIELTALGNSYWYNTGAHQATYQRLWDELVPASGSAATLKGELIRAIGRLVYEHCNNGNCNARHGIWDTVEEDCWSCGGDGWYDEEEEEECGDCGGSGYVIEEEECEAEVSEFYDRLLCLIEDYVPGTTELTAAVRRLICNSPDDFSDAGMQTYNVLCDHVICWVADSDNEDIPLEKISYDAD